MLKHCIENGEQFPHASHQGDFRCFACIAQRFVKITYHRVRLLATKAAM
jgi:hypothetical protein